MAWDIYGEPLRRGYCEAHPYVHEEYPCSVCLESGRKMKADEMIKKLQVELAGKDAVIKQLRDDIEYYRAQAGAKR